MILTKQLIHAALNWGSPNRHQCKILGIAYPLPGGWLRDLVGANMTDETYARLVALKKPLKKPVDNVPQGIVRDDQHNFGRPRLEQSGVGTLVITRRFLAGESVSILAEDYGTPMSEIEKAIRFEIRLKRRSKDEPKLTTDTGAEEFANAMFEENGRDLA